MTAISIAAFISGVLGAVSFLVLRRLTLRRVAVEDLSAWIDFDWRSTGPLERLLSPTEFERLSERGLSRQRVRQLRARRRTLFRMYLRRLTGEFNTAHASLQIVLVNADIDRPDLARELNHQRLLFYRGLLGVELRLLLNAVGFDAVPSLELLRPLERLHVEFCRLVPVAAA
jgi:hypothetical protein